MAEQIITIDSIMGGKSRSKYYADTEEFLNSIAIDPDLPENDTGDEPCGLLRPTAMEHFTGATLTGIPIWITEASTVEKAYMLTDNGDIEVLVNSGGVIARSSQVASIGDASDCMAYYKDYLYITRTGDVARYGPLSSSPSVFSSYWVSGLVQTAMASVTMPSINGVSLPSHIIANSVSDDALYIADYQSNVSYVHRISLDDSDGDFNSEFKALAVRRDLRVTCMANWGENLVLGCINGTSDEVRQQPAKLLIWDKESDDPTDITPDSFSDPLITAVKNVNGQIYVASGYPGYGCRIWRLLSVRNLELVASMPDSPPPLPGAMTGLVNRLVFGGYKTNPESAGTVFAFGSKEGLPLGLHTILKVPAPGTNPIVTCMNFLELYSNGVMIPIVGYKSSSMRGLARRSTTYGDHSIIQSQIFRIGGRFQISEVRIPLAQVIAANMAFTVKFFDMYGTQLQKAGSNYVITVTNAAPYSGKKTIKVDPGITGENGFYMQIEWTGSALCTIALPITIRFNDYDKT